MVFSSGHIIGGKAGSLGDMVNDFTGRPAEDVEVDHRFCCQLDNRHLCLPSQGMGLGQNHHVVVIDELLPPVSGHSDRPGMSGFIGNIDITGVISSLTNPKTGLFFLALLPPFLPQSPSPIDHTLLVATVAGCILLYGALLSAVADRVGRSLTAGSGPIVIDAVAGVVLIVLGITVVLI